MKQRRFFALSVFVLILTVLISTISFAKESDAELTGYNSKELKSLERFDKAFLKNQSKASEAHNKLHGSFGIPEELNEDDYPDYYGGAYTNDEGKLVVYVTDDSENIESKIKDRTGSDEVIIKPCQYSFRSLTRLMNKLNKYKTDKPSDPVSKNFNSYALLDGENKIVVYLDEYNRERIAEFKKSVIDSPAIEFKKSIGKVTPEINVNAGSAITSTMAGSVGFRARLNGVNGIITAGHVANLNAYVQKSGTNFAQCTARQFSGSVDASYCKITNSNYAPTNTLEGTSNTLSTTTSLPGVGTVINKIGSSTGHTSGKILSTNASATYSGVTFTNLTTADYSSAPGDSGGIVYSYISSTNTRPTLGIHVAAGGSTRYYVKASQINSALGTSRY